MNTASSLERCLSFIHCHIQPKGVPGFDWTHTPKPAVTVSREAGCGAHAFAEMLAAMLNSVWANEPPEWTVFDRNLVETVLADHNLPERLATYMPEDRKSLMDDIIEELFGLHPSSDVLVEKISATILHLAEVGNTIIIGRGGNFVTGRLPNVIHVRLIGSRARRVHNLQMYQNLQKSAAEEILAREDLARARYVRKNFGQDVANPLQYHLVINTDLVSHKTAVEMTANLVLSQAALMTSVHQATML